ncbi:MAG: TonB-dependent receptor plug domain-containing protein [Pseudanabaena sp. SU_2_4]|nr:TonB-dependent receptor plug domain-containing protein [Pseudanabaena sp. SU_2_4]
MGFVLRSLFFKLNIQFYLVISVLFAGQSAWANDLQVNSDSQLLTQPVITEDQIDLVGDLQQVPTTIKPLLAQEANSAAIKITGVKVNPSATGVEIVLETTTGSIATPAPKTWGKILYFDIPNAGLELAENKEFRAENPAKGIANILVTQASPTYVRVQIIGAESVPTAMVATNERGLVITSVPSATTVATIPEEDEVEITVTDEQQRGYRVPNATTATRTDTAILDTPQSIQVIPQQILKDQQIIRVDQALRNVSGVTGNFGTFGGAEILTIRGFTTDSFANTPILRDGFRVYYNLGPQETANLEQIEVIKGPSSVLYGQNEPGGLINLVTKQPLSKPFYDLQFQAGNFGLIRPSLDLTGPLDADGNLLYRLNLAYQRSNGFRDFQTDNERFFVAPVLKWKIKRSHKYLFHPGIFERSDSR